jgi:hypothetical protein
MKLSKRDIILIVLGVVIVAALWAAPPQTTSRVPLDQTHAEYYDVARSEGKKAAEVFCVDCHNEEMMPLPEGHPPPFRCLFCHKLERQ